MVCSSDPDVKPREEKPPITKVPDLNGMMIYHSYTSYDRGDSQMFLFDFTQMKLERISDKWNISNAMNAHFSPDGKSFVFMGVGAETGTWDIFLCQLDAMDAPVNLTATGYTRDEDPKFSPDGKRIAFKRNFRIAEMELATGNVLILSPTDYSMPYYNVEGTKIVCSRGDGATSSIAVIDIQSKVINTLYDVPNVQDYYPIGADATSFYYSSGYSQLNKIDQVYRGFWNGLKSRRMPFNDTDGDYSDAYSAGSDWVVISSTRTGTKGGYDLYIAHAESGEVFTMNEYHSQINTSKNELGATIFLKQ
jgi:hypothetical protein